KRIAYPLPVRYSWPWAPQAPGDRLAGGGGGPLAGQPPEQGAITVEARQRLERLLVANEGQGADGFEPRGGVGIAEGAQQVGLGRGRPDAPQSQRDGAAHQGAFVVAH